MTVADYIVRFLEGRGVTHVFEVSGGMITPLLDAAARAGAPKLVSCHHEQAAGFAAEGWARMTGIPGVTLATSGPGATNLLTAIGSCYFDGTPAVFITGQVPRSERRGLRYCRQMGFQETDIVEMARPVTKYATTIVNASRIYETLARAFDVATSGRPGPVLLDIPFDVQREEADGVVPGLLPDVRESNPPDKRTLWTVESWLAGARRPLVLLGNGAHSGGAALREMLERLYMPVVYSLHAKDILSTNHPLNVGFIGSYGNRWANWVLAHCDVLLVLGSRLDVRQTGADVEAFARGKTIIQVDIDPDEMGQRVAPNVRIESSAVDFCKALLPELLLGYGRPGWRSEIEAKRAAWLADAENAVSGVNPNEFMQALGEAFPHAAAFVVDVGSHQMWAAQSIVMREGQRFLTSGGMGAMGWALPAAIGAALASPGKSVVAVMGDGGAQLNLGALATIARLNLPIKTVVLSNGGHGMVAQFQDEVFGGRRTSTMLPSPQFAAIAEAYGIPSLRPDDSLCDANEVDKALGWLRIDGPSLLEIPIDPKAGAYPKLRHGHALDDMYPEKKS